MVDSTPAKPGEAGGIRVTAEGELLNQVHRRLVRLHMSLATADAVNREFQRRLMHAIMDVLHEIEDNPQFQIAHEAEMERRRLHPTPEELAAQERGRAVVERWRQARAERLARGSAETAVD